MAAVGRLTRQLSEERASGLAKEAIELSRNGHLELASRTLRQAAALDHDNIEVQAAFLAIHQEQNTSPLIDLCRRYAQYHDPRAGSDAVKYLRSSDATHHVATVALECLQLILAEKSSALSSLQDIIVAELARQSLQVRVYFAARLSESTTEFFDNIYDRGDEAANCLRSIVLDSKLWPNEETRLRVEDDLFQLFLAKLMESGHDNDSRALKGIALLLLADTERLHYFIDEDAFEALLVSLDLRLPADVRGQATLVISKFLEVSEVECTSFLTASIQNHIARRKGEDLVIAFSAAAHLFPVTTSIMASLFLVDGFLTGLMPFLDNRFGNPIVHDSFLLLLNAACIDGACRAAIGQTCTSWLSHKVSNGMGKQPAMAATILAKLRTSGIKGTDQRANKADDDVSELVDLFKTNLVVEEGKNISDSIEGLAYTSLKPEVKEKLMSDQAFLTALLRTLDENPDSPEIVVGGLSIISNLTHFQPNLSEEQKRISQLRAYANASKPSESSPLEDNAHVEARCSGLVQAGVTATLTKINKSVSSATLQLTDKILLSLSQVKKDRGKIAQQGAVKLLVSHAQKVPVTPASRPETPITPLSPARPSTPGRLKSYNSSPQLRSLDASHALARLLISLNPAHVFPSGGTPHITDAVSPLARLLKAPPSDGPSSLSDQPRDLLPVFEALLALTNLASSPDQSAANAIIRIAWDDIEDLLLNNNEMIRRAACELICNLTAYPAGVGRFADGSRRATERLKIMIAMADVDDEKTRSAAGGALAMLTEYETVTQALITDTKQFPRTLEVILDLVAEEDDPGLVHRGLAVLINLVSCPDDDGANPRLGEKARTAVKAIQGGETIRSALRRIRDPNILSLGVEVLKSLAGERQ